MLVPIVFPVIQTLGFDPIWFGIFVVVAAEMSYITPPMGLNVFVMRVVARDVPVQTIFAGVMPFVVMDMLRIVLLILIPGIALLLPSMM